METIAVRWTEITAGGWALRVDVETTRERYATSDSRGAAECSCAACCNYLAQRDRVFPPQLSTLLDSLGIDPEKEAEVHEWGPASERTVTYSGWWHCIGTLITQGSTPVTFDPVPGTSTAPWQVTFQPGKACALPELAGESLVQVEFMTELEGILEE